MIGMKSSIHSDLMIKPKLLGMLEIDTALCCTWGIVTILISPATVN